MSDEQRHQIQQQQQQLNQPSQQQLQRRHNCCRLCLAPDNECISILNSYAADKEPLASKIHTCVSVKVSWITQKNMFVDKRRHNANVILCISIFPECQELGNGVSYDCYNEMPHPMSIAIMAGCLAGSCGQGKYIIKYVYVCFKSLYGCS